MCDKHPVINDACLAIQGRTSLNSWSNRSSLQRTILQVAVEGSSLDDLLLEDGDYLLMEDGSFLQME